MHKLSSKKSLLLCFKYGPLFSSAKQNTSRKGILHLIFRNESSKFRCLSSYSHLGSHQNPSNANSFEKIAEARRGFDLVHLKSEPEPYEDSQPQDQFAADVEKVYRILRKFHSRVPKLELALQESGIVARSGLTERVLNRCGDAGNLGYRFFVWASKQPGYRHSYDVYKAMLKILGKMRQFGAVWALIEEMRKENPHLLSSEVFVVLMRRFASARMVKKAIEVLDQMQKYGCELDEYVFGCLLDSFRKIG